MTLLQDKLNDFIASTTKSKIAVVVPLFGYWKDAPSDQLNQITLKLALDRMYSSVHNIVMIFVSEAPRLPDDIASILIGRAAGGNTMGVLIKKKGANYVDYLREGIKVALESTDAQFIVSINPWILVQHNAVDILIDRVNRDDAKLFSGFDVRGLIDSTMFDKQTFTMPKEEKDFNFDFFGMRRSTAELIEIDDAYRTHWFLARDFWASSYNRGFEAITTQRVPVFPFDVDWTEFEGVADFEQDRQYFIKKWKYDPGIKYANKQIS